MPASFIATNLHSVQQQIATAAMQAQRDLSAITLLAVSKAQNAESIREAFQAGQHAFGENYVQEALAKMQSLNDLPIQWHFIGHIQANKTKAIAENFAWVHSVDRFKIAERLQQQRPAHLPPLNVCIELNLGAEATKSGTNSQDLLALVQEIAALPRLRLRGLMVIPPALATYAQQLAFFQQVATVQQTLKQQGFQLDTLSMGMSNDFAAAIAAGSTIVRIGTAIFGPRK